MKRHDWKLSSGICAGSVGITEDGIKCDVLKVKDSCPIGEAGNVFVREIETGIERWVLGRKIKLCE